jgi:hypothetical protein
LGVLPLPVIVVLVVVWLVLTRLTWRAVGGVGHHAIRLGIALLAGFAGACLTFLVYLAIGAAGD